MRDEYLEGIMRHKTPAWVNGDKYSAEQINNRLDTTEDDWESHDDAFTYTIHKPDGGTLVVEDEAGDGKYTVLRGWGM